jgi:hypothetical protein
MKEPVMVKNARVENVITFPGGRVLGEQDRILGMALKFHGFSIALMSNIH